MQKLWWFGGLGVTQGHRKHHHDRYIEQEFSCGFPHSCIERRLWSMAYLLYHNLRVGLQTDSGFTEW